MADPVVPLRNAPASKSREAAVPKSRDLKPWANPVTWLALGVGALLAWRLADVLLLAFGAVLVAILLNALARPLTAGLRLSRPAAVAVVAVGMPALLVAGVWLFGSQISQQVAVLGELLPRAWAGVARELSRTSVGATLLADLQRWSAGGALLDTASRLIQGSASGVAAAVIVMFAGLYLAFHPQTYSQGALSLLPAEMRRRASEVLIASGAALDRWLIGQLVSMALVGASVWAGLTLVGAPSPLALGVIAGLGQFVPVIGPMAAAVPGLIVAGGADSQTLLWTAAVYLGASQVEANVITPLVLRRMVELPMAVTLFAVLAMGVLFGPLGVLFATPLAVVGQVLVKQLYIDDLLNRGPEHSQEGTPP